jgi:hypothetical protein
MEGLDRGKFLHRCVEELRRRGHHPLIDGGWSRCDLEVPCAPGSVLRIRTVQEFYGGNSAQIAIDMKLCDGFLPDVLFGAGIATIVLGFWSGWQQTFSAEVSVFALGSFLVAPWFWSRRRGYSAASRIAKIIDQTAKNSGMTLFEPEKKTSEEKI